MSEYLALLPRDLQEAAYIASGIDEEAWPRVAALRVVEYLASASICVLGGEVWLATSPGPAMPDPFIYHWEVADMEETEDWSHFVNRAKDEATAYIRGFQWDPRERRGGAREPYFNLSLCSASRYETLKRL